MTKHPNLHEEALKNQFNIEDVKAGTIPKILDDSLVIGTSQIGSKPRNKMKNTMAKSRAPTKRVSRLCRATQNLYDLEECHGPEKKLNVDFDLYQMEDY